MVNSVLQTASFPLPITSVALHSGQGHLKVPLSTSKTVVFLTWEGPAMFQREPRMGMGLGRWGLVVMMKTLVTKKIDSQNLALLLLQRIFIQKKKLLM